MRGGAKVIIQPHRLEGIYVAKGQQDALVTKSFYPGESVYNEKRISIQVFKGLGLFLKVFLGERFHGQNRIQSLESLPLEDRCGRDRRCRRYLHQTRLQSAVFGRGVRYDSLARLRYRWTCN